MSSVLASGPEPLEGHATYAFITEFNALKGPSDRAQN